MSLKKSFFAPIGSGIGDVVVALPVIEHLVAYSGGAVYLVARGPRQLGFDGCIPGLAGTIREVDLIAELAKPENEDACYINLRDHKLQTHYDWYSDEFARAFPGYRINEIMRDVCAEDGFTPDFSRFPRFLSRERKDVAGKIALVPGATSDFKALPVMTWEAIIGALSARGLEYFLLGEAERSPVVAQLVAAGIPYLPTPSIRDAVDVLSSARAVISVDTGLMHIAVQQGTPTLAVFNRVHTYYREAPHCKPVFGPVCDPVCKAGIEFEFPFPVDYKEWVWWDGSYDYCKSSQPCMSRVTAEEVTDAFDELLCTVSGAT